MNRRLYRSRTDRVIFGVAGGLGHYFDIDPVIFRVAFVAFTFVSGVGILAYLILAIAAPLEPVNSAGQGQASASSTGQPPAATAAPDQAGTSFGEYRRSRHGHGVVGLILIGVGVFFLLAQLGWFWWLGWEWRILWPLILIALGLFIILRRARRE